MQKLKTGSAYQPCFGGDADEVAGGGGVWLDRPKYRSHEMRMGGLRLTERPMPAGVGGDADEAGGDGWDKTGQKTNDSWCGGDADEAGGDGGGAGWTGPSTKAMRCEWEG